MLAAAVMVLFLARPPVVPPDAELGDDPIWVQCSAYSAYLDWNPVVFDQRLELKLKTGEACDERGCWALDDVGKNYITVSNPGNAGHINYWGFYRDTGKITGANPFDIFGQCKAIKGPKRGR